MDHGFPSVGFHGLDQIGVDDDLLPVQAVQRNHNGISTAMIENGGQSWNFLSMGRSLTIFNRRSSPLALCGSHARLRFALMDPCIQGRVWIELDHPLISAHGLVDHPLSVV